MSDDHPTCTWLFGHGSLMFRPDFGFVERRLARVVGYSRRFGQPSTRNWGRPGSPAPTCSLVDGDAVDGIAFRIAQTESSAVIAQVRKREAREPVVVRAEVAGTNVSALTWPMDDAWSQLSVDELVAAALTNVEGGGGPSGNAWSYLDGVKRTLDSLGVRDPLVDDYHRALETKIRSQE